MVRMRDITEFAAILAQAAPGKSENHISWLADEFMKLGRAYARLQERYCNVGDLPPALGRREKKIESGLAALAATLAATVVFSGDPRGATVKLRLPSGRSNSFGGDGWCVPGS